MKPKSVNKPFWRRWCWCESIRMIYKLLLIALRWCLLHLCAYLVKAQFFLSGQLFHKKIRVPRLIHVFLCVYAWTHKHTQCPREMSDILHIFQKLRKGEKEKRGQWKPFIYWWVKRGEEDQLGARGEQRRRGSVQSFLWRPLLWWGGGGGGGGDHEKCRRR